MIWIPLLLFFISCIFLVGSGGYLVKLLIKISRYLRLSEFVVAFIIMAFSTSIPELFVGINSAIKGNPALSLGNVIGSNIADLTLIIGIAALLGKGIKVKNPFIRKDSLFMLLIAILPIGLMFLGKSLSRIDGIILVSVFLIYMWHLSKERKELKNQFKDEHNKNHLILTFILFALCLAVLFISSHFVVKYATDLALELLLPPILIGLFFVAIGTSLPELVFEIKSVLAKRGDFAVGDAMGSVVCNSSLVLGVTAIIYPITSNFLLFITSAIFMILVSILFLFFIRGKKGLSVTKSIILIILYLLFIMFEYLIK